MSVIAPPPTTSRAGNPWVMLALATVGFAVNFWAWALLSPLGPCTATQVQRSRVSYRARSPCWSPSRCSSARWAGSRSARSPTGSAAA